jgi:hypothetical protein
LVRESEIQTAFEQKASKVSKKCPWKLVPFALRISLVAAADFQGTGLINKGIGQQLLAEYTTF